MMTRADLFHVFNALEDAEAEFEQLMIEREWFVTEVTDRLLSAKEIIIGELNGTNKVSDK